MDGDVCRGVTAWQLDTGEIHVFRAHLVILATGGYGRAYFSATSAHTCTGDGNAMTLRAGLPLQDMEFVQSPPDGHLWIGLPDHRRRARRRRLPDQLGRRALHGALCAFSQGPGVARCRVALDDHGNPRRPRCRTQKRTTSTCTSTTCRRKSCTSVLPGISESAKIFAGVDVTKEPIPVIPTVPLQYGRLPTNYHGEVLTKKGDNADTRRAGPDGGRRSGLRFGARRQPPGIELADRPCRLRPRRRPARQGTGHGRRGAQGHRVSNGRRRPSGAAR